MENFHVNPVTRCEKVDCFSHVLRMHIQYCMHRVNLLRHYGVKPILVFDGGLLPMKSEQENKRARSRKENLSRAIEHEANGNSAAAYECYQKAVDISPSIAHELIQALKQENVSYVVAPYEADAQMTFLAISKQVDAVITEDSDLIPFGCPRIVFKMDKYGQGIEFQYSRLQLNKELSFSGFTHEMILQMCILSGCDYLQSLPGMGLKRAHALITKFKSYDKVIKHLKYSTISVPPLYEESFRKAILTFQHQRVYDPIAEDIIHLSDLADNLGFASLEAKRNFRAPRTSPINPSPVDKSSLSPNVNCNLEVASSNMDCSAATPLDYGNMKSTMLDDTVESGFAAEDLELSASPTPGMIGEERSSVHNLLQELGDSTHKPFQALLKECDSKSVTTRSVLQDERKAENKKVIVQSSYFEPTPINKFDEDNEKEKLLVKNAPTDPCDGSILKSAYKIRTADNKITIRSSYFQHNSVNKNDKKNEHERLLVESDAAMGSDMNEDVILDIASSENNSIGMKRKTSQNGTVQRENMNMRTKHMRTDASLSENGGKFGSNISHLSHYSDIAEKSMERFVSVISSFKFSSSGSRASGLRAPLRDIQNTSTSRSNVDVDFSRFAYTPKDKKTGVALRRC
ncbi:exonuclease, putative [Ricinus communis]|uniref:Exonuclease, putative n=1 Tax=Ricinus communis TaxID=3988 RepID=B9S8I1_RICCO|nr:exonuclease, putative [Ricinus communis]